MPKYFDIHSHLDMYEPDERTGVLSRMEEYDVWTTTIGTNPDSSQRAVELAAQNERVYAAVGMHPEDATEYAYDADRFRELARREKVVAIGECGLDYYHSAESGEPSTETQKELFEAQIDLAVEHVLPLMLHIRPSGKETMDAYEDALEILEHHYRTYGEKLTGNAHFFVGDTDIARRFLDIGFSVSFTGVITFVPSFNEVVRYVPLDMMHAETDAPFVAPEPHRGEQNEPSNVRYVVEHIAKLRKADRDQVDRQLVHNAESLFVNGEAR